MQSVKCVVVGDTGVGKTCLLISYTTRAFPGEYVPEVFENYCANMLIDQKPFLVHLWDTHGQSTYDSTRPESYTETDVFLVCYSITSPSSFENVATKWVPELHNYNPNIPIVLVATKLDLKDDQTVIDKLRELRMEIISTDNGMKKAKEVGAMQFFECSALTQAGLARVFKEAVQLAANRRNPPTNSKKKGCIIL